MARPRKELTDEDFDKLVAMVRIQCTQDEICAIFGMTKETLNARLQERGEESFSTLYKKHSDEGKASLRRMQWKAAENGNVGMLVWLGKQMLGQSDKQEVKSETTERVVKFTWGSHDTPPQQATDESAND